MPVARAVALGLLLLGACTESGDFESNCTRSCSAPDGGTFQEKTRIACCGVHDNPTHPNEEGTDCTPDWVTSRTSSFCAEKRVAFVDDAGALMSLDCQANESYRCNCEAPHTYPSFDGCD